MCEWDPKNVIRGYIIHTYSKPLKIPYIDGNQYEEYTYL